MNTIRRAYRAWKRRRRAERDMAEEFQIHIDMEAAWREQDGLLPSEARRQARIAFGGVERHKEAARESRPFAWFDDLARDLSFVWRQVVRQPGFTIVVVSTMALGIAANTAVFSIVNGVILKALPYRDADRLVVLTGHGYRGELLELRKLAKTLDVSAVAPSRPLTLTGYGEPVRLDAAAALPDLLPLLGVDPLIGRAFRAEEGLPGAEPTVILSHHFWIQSLGGDTLALGRELRLDGVAHRIVGVMPAAFDYPSETTDVWTPLVIDPGDRIGLWSTTVGLVGRLRADVSVETARAEIRALVPAFRALFPWKMPAEYGRDANVIPLEEHLVGNVRTALVVLLCGVGAVLLIVCVNVANLMLVRSMSRARELTIRAAIGAGRGRLVRQLLTETVVLAGTAAGIGLAVAFWTVHALKQWLPAGIPRADSIGVDGTVLLFTAGLAVLCALISGAFPALRVLGFTAENLAGTTRASFGTPSQRRISRTLASGQIALAAVLTIVAALLVKSFWTLVSVDPGFRRDGLVVASIAPSVERYRAPDARRAYVRDLLERARDIPGVGAVAASSAVPFGGAAYGSVFSIEGRPDPATQSGEWPWADVRAAVSADYFQAMGIPLTSGRGPTSDDRAGAPLVAVISRSLADMYWPGTSAVGARIRFPGTEPWISIVGVAGDVKWADLAESNRSSLYLPFEQAAVGSIRLALRTSPGSEAAVAAGVRQVVSTLDKDTAVSQIGRAADLMRSSVERPRFIAAVLSGFSMTALVLGAIGVYGVLAYSVSRRTREIGVRMALGARRSEVIVLVLRQGLGLAIGGAIAGVGAGLVLTRWLSGLLFGVEPTDPAIFSLVPLVLIVVAICAASIPARRAAQVDPVAALRSE